MRQGDGSLVLTTVPVCERQGDVPKWYHPFIKIVLDEAGTIVTAYPVNGVE